MIHLIGVSQGVPLVSKREDLPRAASFAQYLRERAKELKAVLIAEELSEEALNELEALAAVAQCVSKELDIEHRFCDPDSNERKTFEIPSVKEIKIQLNLGHVHGREAEILLKNEERKHFRKREAFWFKKIEDETDKPVIFVCGSDHVESFQRLLIENGIKVEVLEGNWGAFFRPGDSIAL